MDYKNDNRTPRDRVTGEFLSELLFTESGGDCNCGYNPSVTVSSVSGRTAEKSPRESVVRNTVCEKANCQNARGIDRGNRNVCTDNSARRGGVEFSGNYSLAMAYIPMQEFGDLFDIEEGFCEGTIFRSLRFPFYPTPCRKECE